MLLRDVYAEYRKAGYNKTFYAEHESEILIHQAAKKAFDTLGLKKIPSIKGLQQEYATLSAKKKKLYVSYHASKNDMREILNAKTNVDRLLGYRGVEHTKETEKPQH